MVVLHLAVAVPLVLVVPLAPAAHLAVLLVPGLNKEEMRLAARVAHTLLPAAALAVVPGLNKEESLRSTYLPAAALVLVPGLNKEDRPIIILIAICLRAT